MIFNDFSVGTIAKIHAEELQVIRGDGSQLDEEAFAAFNFPDAIRTPLGDEQSIMSLTKMDTCPFCRMGKEVLGLILETVVVYECSRCEKFAWMNYADLVCGEDERGK